MKRYFALALALVLGVTGQVRAEGPDDFYLKIYELIQEGDTLKGNSQPSQALAKYNQAQTALQSLQRGYPDWNTKVVSFRLNYLANRIAEVSAAESTTTKTAAPSQSPNSSIAIAQAPKPSAPDNWQEQMSQLTGRVTQLESERTQLQTERNQLLEDKNGLQADKNLLEAKLKEALAAQPAAVDPAELVRAQEKITNLQKENDLLKVTLDQEKTKHVPVPDPKALEQSQQTISDLNHKLATQTELVSAMALEKQVLESRLAKLSVNTEGAAQVAKLNTDLASANRQLAEQKTLVTKLESDKQSLELRLKNGGQDPEAFAALQAENQLLKKQVADFRSVTPKGKNAELTRQLTEARAQIAALESDKEMLRLEKEALENHSKQIATAASPASASVSTAAAASVPLVPVVAKSQDPVRVQQLEEERAALQKKLEAAYKELYGTKGKAASSRVQDLQNQIERLQARLDAFEARQIPFSTEELALFHRPDSSLATNSAPTKRSVHELAPAAAALVLEARRYFSAGQYDKAEQNYESVVSQDEKNVPALANLAMIQIEHNHLDAAQTNIDKALALDPKDAYSLSVLGNLKFRQAKYDEALDALSQAAKLDPQNAEIQNYLGLTLSEKGLRGPAEAALRKAIQIEPGYGSAHNNLAVIYLTQQPPAIELARWHYQRALASGFGRNPELEKMLADAK
jgi:Tfp pilus assembly protein PilF